MTTHYIEEAERLCDRVAIIDDGRIIAIGTPRELQEQSADQSGIEMRWSSRLPTATCRSGRTRFARIVSDDRRRSSVSSTRAGANAGRHGEMDRSARDSNWTMCI